MLQQSRIKPALYLAFLVLMWGVNWPLSKYALTYTPPLLFAGLRTFIGGLLLISFAVWKRKQLHLKGTWHIYLISSALNIILYYGFQTIGLQYMPAGLFSAIVFLQPVLLGIFSWIWLGESMYGLKILGLLLGFFGVASLTTDGFTGNMSAWGIIFAITSAISWACGTVYTKKTAAQVDSVWMTALQITIGGIVMLGSGSAIESWSDISWNTSFIIVTLFISIFVIALGWLVYFQLLATIEASKVGAFTFLIPLISVIFSVLFLHEQVTYKLIVGLLLITGSIVLVNFKPKRFGKTSKFAMHR
ncbi:DMT family transporter [Brevibacillus laterosporus]|uniref:DMT family transporter n=1 Tax=Brevibacillus TaxID=55080 RepID=UPI001B07B321|nr:DMT family transporter [Brevibacillus halotolerans]GIO00011.1 transporter [Brevibacillus halotolerans]